MKTISDLRTRAGLCLAVLACLSWNSACVVTAEPAQPLPYAQDRELQSAVDVTPGKVIRIENLAGEFSLEPGSGSRVEVSASVHAEGRDDAAANSLADGIRLELLEEDGKTVLRAVYPVEEFDRFYYRRGDRETGFLAMFSESNTRVRYMGRRVNVSTRRRGDSASVWADMRVRVPAGVRLEVMNAIGPVEARDVSAASLSLDVHIGAVVTTGGEGDLLADTGSGGVTVEDHRGDVVADTGSGSVSVTQVQGSVTVDTGSGGVTVQDAEGALLSVDTGSGSVRMERVSGAMTVDTGSGSVRLLDVVAGRQIVVDTGSGSVRIEGDLAATREVSIDTSSGSVHLRLSAWPSLTLELSTGSGGIDVDLPDVVVRRSDRDHLIGMIGDGSAGSMIIDTGSGGISVQERS